MRKEKGDKTNIQSIAHEKDVKMRKEKEVLFAHGKRQLTQL